MNNSRHKLIPKSLKGFVGYFSVCLIIGTVKANSLPSNLESRIINGTEVNWSNTRYQVSVRLEFIDRIYFGSGHMCGGSLIASNVVLTASHCVWNDNTHQFRKASEFSIVMGNLDRTVKSDNTLKLFVREIITSADFSPTTFRDDYALMILSESIPDSYTGSSIIQMNEDRNLPVGTKCTVSGWGITEKSTYTKKLMAVDVPIISKTECSINYGSETIMDGMLCAGYMIGERDACSGDSGGPLVCGDKLVGIVSFGIGCALSGYPGVYSDVAYYAERIRNKLGLLQKQNTELVLPADYYNYTIGAVSKNATGSTNSTNVPSSSTIVYRKSFVWMLLLLLSGFIKLL